MVRPSGLEKRYTSNTILQDWQSCSKWRYPLDLLTMGRTSESQTHNIFMHIGYNIDDYKYSFYPFTITDWNNIPINIINTPSLRPSRIGWRACLLPGPECSCTFLTPAFILQTYHLCHNEVLVINNSDSENFSDLCLCVNIMCHRYGIMYRRSFDISCYLSAIYIYK